VGKLGDTELNIDGWGFLGIVSGSFFVVRGDGRGYGVVNPVSPIMLCRVGGTIFPCGACRDSLVLTVCFGTRVGRVSLREDECPGVPQKLCQTSQGGERAESSHMAGRSSRAEGEVVLLKLRAFRGGCGEG